MKDYTDRVATHLVAGEGIAPQRALVIVAQWSQYITSRQRGGKSAASTARHLARFKRERTVCSCSARRDCGCGAQQARDQSARRDASPRGRSTRSTRGGVRKDAGQTRISAKGIPYKICPRGTRLQALLLPRANYNEAQARAWAVARGMRPIKVTTEANHVRVRLHDPRFFVRESFRLIPLRGYERHGIRGLIGCPRVAIVKGGAASKASERAIRKAA